jgi:hypothetical protein
MRTKCLQIQNSLDFDFSYFLNFFQLERIKKNKIFDKTVIRRKCLEPTCFEDYVLPYFLHQCQNVTTQNKIIFLKNCNKRRGHGSTLAYIFFKHGN